MPSNNPFSRRSISKHSVGKLTVHNRCPWCGTPSSVVVPEDLYYVWEEQGDSEKVFGLTLTASEREIILTGFHPECWDECFYEDEEVEDIWGDWDM